METKIFFEDLTRKKKAIGIIHRVYLTKQKTSRNYLASTKTRSEVRGGGRKPWKQKGTGNARAGSKRSPLFVGGGVIFGPKFKTVKRKINKKENQLAILAAIYLKKNEIFLLDQNVFEDFNEIKTKKITKILEKLNVNENEKSLFILEKPNKNFWLSTRNIKNVQVTSVNCLNIKQLIENNNIIISQSTLEKINLIYGKTYI